MATLNDQYTIGINIDVNGASLDILTKFNKIVQDLTKNFASLTDVVNKFNDSLGVTSALISDAGSSLAGLSEKISTSFSSAAVSVRALNAEMRGAAYGAGASSKGKGHIGMALPLAAVGFLGYEGFKQYGSVQNELMALKATGFGQGFVNSAYQQAMGNKAGLSPAEYLAEIQNATAVIRNPKAALQLAPTLGKMIFANRILYASEGRQFTDNDMAMIVRFAEIYSHASTAKGLTPGLNLAQKVFGTEVGKIPAHFLQDFARRYAVGLPNLSQDAIFRLIPIMQVMGGSQLGTALTQFESVLTKGMNFRTGKRAIAEFKRLGLFNANDQAIDLKLAMNDPSKWIQSVFLPHLASAGITSPTDIQKEITFLFAGTSARLASLLTQNMNKSVISAREGRKALGIGGVFDLTNPSNAAAVAHASAAWKTFTTEIGLLVSPSIVGGLNALTKALGYLTDFLQYLTKMNSSNNQRMSSFWNKHSGWKDYFYHGMVFNHAGGQAAHTTVNVKLDGKTIASTTISSMNKMMNNPLAVGNSTTPNLNYTNSSSNFIPGISF